MSISIADYLIKKLKDSGCRHVFGIPGTSCADFFFAIEKDSEIQYVLGSNELEVGYMADGYSRFAGLGAVCVSYGVGTLSLVNAVASAFTEKVPMIVINGGPKKADKDLLSEFGVLFSHSTGKSDTDLTIFKSLTVGTLLCEEGMTSLEVDALFEKAIQLLGPVYIEIPSDMWNRGLQVKDADRSLGSGNCDQLDRLIQELAAKLSDSQRPALLIGSEVSRRNMGAHVERWIEKLQIPFATTLLSKSVISERNPLFVGTYDSDLAPKSVRQVLEDSDCLITIGCIFGVDHTLLINKQYNQMADISYGHGRIGVNTFSDIDLVMFIDSSGGLLDNKARYSAAQQDFGVRRQQLNARSSEECTHDTIYAAIDEFLNDTNQSYFFASDTCLGSYPSADLKMPDVNMFLANPIWLSIGQSTPAAAGAHFAKKKRPLIVTGDGGFQMIAQSFSTMVRYQIPAIIIIIDNSLYAIEQFLLDGKYFVEVDKPPIAFNILHPWKYEAFPAVFGGFGVRVHTIPEFKLALQDAHRSPSGPWIIAAELPRKDLPAENLSYILNNP